MQTATLSSLQGDSCRPGIGCGRETSGGGPKYSPSALQGTAVPNLTNLTLPAAPVFDLPEPPCCNHPVVCPLQGYSCRPGIGCGGVGGYTLVDLSQGGEQKLHQPTRTQTI